MDPLTGVGRPGKLSKTRALTRGGRHALCIDLLNVVAAMNVVATLLIGYIEPVCYGKISNCDNAMGVVLL